MNQIFNPSSIAVIGASDNHSKTGYTILENIQNSHFKGKIYKINNKGNRFYKSILDIKDDIDMAIIIIPKKEVLEVVKECIQKKISSIVIISGGFRESGDIKSEEEIKKLLKGTKTRIIGPNSCGIFSSHINASFSKNENDKDGNLFLITQSGAILTSLVDFSRSSNLGISKAISLGNKMDISETDIIPNIEPNDFLCFYLESIDNFKEFIKDFGKIENPVFVLSPGKSNKSKLEIKSHTGAIVSDKDILSLGMAKNNIIELSSMEDLFDVSRIFSNLKYKKIKNTKLAIITNAGGMAILATDMMSDNLSFSKFCTSTLNKLNKYFKGRKISNPIDILGDAKSQRYKDILNILDKDIDTDVILTITTPQSSTDVFNIAKVISDFSKNSEKFIISVFTGGYYADKAIEYLTKINIPSYNFPERAIKSLDYLNRFIKNKSRESTYENEDTSLNNKIISIIKNYKDGEILNFKDAVTILKNFDIKFPKFEIVKNIKELEDGIEKIGYPLTLKIDATNLAHKTDKKGVINNITDYNKLISAYKKLTDISDRIVMQKFVNANFEIMAGAIKYANIGSVIVLGTGGILTEILNDHIKSYLPITRSEAIEILEKTKFYPLLSGYRDLAKYGENDIVDVLMGISYLTEHIKGISQIDINPIVLDTDGNILTIDPKIYVCSN